jgi:hypothetical protein
MSTLTSRQTFKALCSHLRHPLLRPPRPSPYHVGSLQVPFSESPSYDGLARRFSSYPNPVNLSALSSWQKAADSCGYVDIHDICDVSDLELNNYDVLVTDINKKTLRTEASKVFGIDYLAKATEDDAKREVDVITGYLYGEGRRAMVPCVVSNGNKAYWVHFLVGTSAPATFLSEKVHTPTDAENYA